MSSYFPIGGYKVVYVYTVILIIYDLLNIPGNNFNMEEDNVVVSFCIIIIASFMLSIRHDMSRFRTCAQTQSLQIRFNITE